MARTRSRTRQGDYSYTYITTHPSGPGIVKYKSTVKSEEITDNNNGRLRPESSVVHSRATCFRGFIPTYRIGGIYTDWYSGDTIGTDASSVRSYLRSYTATMANDAYKELVFKFYHERASLVKRKDSINFLAELRELPAMFKSLNKYRYLDWEFGWSPMLRDLTDMISVTQDTIDSVKARIGTSGNREQFEKTITVPLEFDEPRFTFAPGFPLRFVFRGKCEVRLRGQYRVLYPDITDEGNLKRLMLDLQGFNADPATIWEAIPFSWLIDWFVPIGNCLENLSGSNFNPTLVMSGTITIKCTGTYELFAAYNHQYGSFKIGYPAGGGTFSYYSRQHFADSLDSMFTELPKIRLPVPDLRKSGILNDVFGKGSSYDDVKKSKHQIRKQFRKRIRKNKLTRFEPSVS